MMRLICPIVPFKSTVETRANSAKFLCCRRSKTALWMPGEVKAVAQALEDIRTAAELDALGAAALLSQAQGRAQTSRP